MIITIDGPAGTGKSTVAKRFAKWLGFNCFCTGALYRAISWKILHEKISLSDYDQISNLISHFSFDFQKIDGRNHYFIDGVDCTHAIFDRKVTEIVSEVSAMKNIRDVINPILITFSKQGSAIFEGRDMGTTVFPNADLKFFLTATPEVRAQRRFKEFQEKQGHSAGLTFEKILADLSKRDLYDSEREIAPLKQASDAILIDTSHLSIEDVINKMKEFYEKWKMQ